MWKLSTPKTWVGAVQLFVIFKVCLNARPFNLTHFFALEDAVVLYMGPDGLMG